MNPYSAYQTLFDEKLNDFLLSIDKTPASLYQPMRYIFSLGGKRIRPLLVYIANDLFNGKTENATPIALAVEIFHNFSLIHDDIMDKAPLRRGKTTIHEKWNNNVAILSGDALLVTAYQQFEKVKTEKIISLLSIFSKTAAEVCEGQQLDMDFEERKTISIDEYQQMITLKTAVLLGAALKMGAVIANANEKDADALYHFGKNIGIAFQIQDDLLDVFGSAEKFGKQTGGDIICNKKTWLLIRAMQDASPSDKAEMEKWIEQKEFLAKDKVEVFKNIYKKLNIKEKAENEMKRYFENAKNNLFVVEANYVKKETLLAFSEYLMKREN
ncbi:MAG: polyprenyl synthetase family protein [Vicingaceae bacterium]|nr:MAG: polyprenyl synthetase family protein [Vicingaceae bacterium]